MSNDSLDLSEEDLTRLLAYAGFVLLAYELLKSLIVDPIKLFYRDTSFSSRPFTSYELDVQSRHKNELEACLLYLRDFTQAIDSDDVLAIQSLRKHRNNLAHDLPAELKRLNVDSYVPLLEKADKALLSNYRTYMEIGHDPEFRDKGINWETVYGSEYMIFKEVVEKVKIRQSEKK